MKKNMQRYLPLLLAGCLAGVAFAQVSTDKCNDITYIGGQTTTPAQGSTVYVNLDGITALELPPNYTGTREQFANSVIQTAAAGVSGAGHVSFSTAAAPAGSPKVLVEFGGVAGRLAASYQGYGQDGKFSKGDLRVYTEMLGCGADPTSKCYDPFQPGYFDALVAMVQHELFHAVGASDSNKDNVMFGFSGVNNRDNSVLELDCVKLQSRIIRSSCS